MVTGCFSERSCPMTDGDIKLVEPPRAAAQATMRDWLADAHAQLEPLLPRHQCSPLCTEDLVSSDGQAVDVFAHFGRKFEDMDTILGNISGLTHTAHLSATKFYVTEKPPAWPGFEEVWIPTHDITYPNLELSGRLGLAERNGQVIQADCIVLLPGLYGDNGVLRTRDLAMSLRDRGFHVLSLELRGCGQTEVRYPHIYAAWGVAETTDLLTVSEWLEAKPEVNRTGLVGFCWGAHTALLTSWVDGRDEDDPSVSAVFRPQIRIGGARRHYTAGIIAFSPVLDFERLMDELEQPQSAIFSPVLNGFQNILKDRKRQKGFEPANGSLRELVTTEIRGYGLTYSNPDDPVWHGSRFLRFLPYKNEPTGDKLEKARVPVLIIQAVNDPLLPAQDVADLIARTENPLVAAVILPGGGHVGFPAYCRSYYYSLILNFFDRQRGPGGETTNEEQKALNAVR